MNFKLWLESISGAPNVHMTHVEDLVFDLGVEGTRKAILFLRDLAYTFIGKTKPVSLSLKFDGSPAVVFGVNPENNKLFVAKKGIFNKTPKLYYTEQDVDADVSNKDLAGVLKTLLKNLPLLGISKGIFQGDVLFTKRLLNKQDGYITFQPNTIVYAVEDGSELGNKIKLAEIGVAVHTLYTGNRIQELKAVFNVPIVHLFKEASRVFLTDATFEDKTRDVYLNEEESKTIKQNLSALGKLFHKIPATAINLFTKNKELLEKVHKFRNSLVRKGIGGRIDVDELVDFIEKEFSVKAEEAKTFKTKQLYADTAKRMVNVLKSVPRQELEDLFTLNQLITETKLILIGHMNKLTRMKTFLRTKDGFKVTAHEGFVAVREGDAVKLVDRLEFSKANFSPEILKGWER